MAQSPGQPAGERPKQPLPEQADPTHEAAADGHKGQEHGIPQGATEEEPSGSPTPERHRTEVTPKVQTDEAKSRRG